MSTTLLIGLIPEAINLFFINSGLSFIVTFSTFFTSNIEQFSVSTFILNSSVIFLLFSSYCKSIFFTFLLYIAATSCAIPSTLNKSPLFAVNSKSIISSSIFKYFIGSSPTGASCGNSCIPSLSSGLKNLLSKPNSAIEHSIPLDSSPRIFPAFIVIPPGRFAPGNATITFNPFLTFGAPHTIGNTCSPTFTLHICKWSESGCGSHSSTSPITKFVAFINFSAESYSLPIFVMSSANFFVSTSIST